MSLSLGIGTGLTAIRKAGGGGPPPYAPSDPDVAAYFTAAESAGATYLQPTKEALDTFVIGMKSASLWALVRRWNPMLADGGDVLAGVARVLNSTVGAANVDTLNNYVGGDWNPASGLQGNVTTTFMNTGWKPTLAQVQTGFAAACYRGNTVTAGFKCLFGTVTTSTSPVQQASIQLSSGDYLGYWGDNLNTTIGGDLVPGLWSVCRTGPSDVRLYFNNGAAGTNLSGGTFFAINSDMYVGARSQNNALHSGSPLAAGSRIAGYIFTNALDSTQRGNLQTLWAAFNTAIGR